MKKTSSLLLSTLFVVSTLVSCATMDDTLVLPDETTPLTLGGGEFNAMGQSSKRFSVSFSSKMTDAEIKNLEEKYNTKFSRVIPQIGIAIADKPEEVPSEQLSNEIKAESTVEDYEPINLVELEATKGLKINDPESQKQYHLDVINADKAWEITSGKPSVKIAIIDSGIDLNHPDLKARLITGRNIIRPSQKPMDDNGHGTHVAGIAAATAGNGIGVVGIAPNCSLMPIKALENGRGTDIDIAEAIVWAADNDADVINISIGLYTKSKALERAVKYAIGKNVVVVSSSGNDSKNSKIHLPSMIKGVIEVSATRVYLTSSKVYEKFADFSNYGQQVSVAAPGDEILSTMPTYKVELTKEAGLKYGIMSGTSMASPMVAGLAALLKSQDSSLTPAEIKQIIEKSSDDLGSKGYDSYFGNGRINMYNTLAN
jgi:subtilisin family serine protease